MPTSQLTHLDASFYESQERLQPCLVHEAHDHGKT